MHNFGEHFCLFAEDVRTFYLKRGWELVRMALYPEGITVNVMCIAVK